MTKDSATFTPEGRSLLEILLSYDAEVKAGAVREEVSGTLERIAGYQNKVVVGSGYTIAADEPVAFGGSGSAPDPAEALIAAVTSSLSVTITAHAALGEIAIDAIQMKVDGWMAADSFFRPEGGAAVGIQDLTIEVRLSSPASRGELERLLAEATLASPVVRSLAAAPHIRLIGGCN